MLEPIFDLLREWWDSLWPIYIVPQYERGIVLRRGILHRTNEPGLHWRWPFIEEVHNCVVVYTTTSLGYQTLQTKDDRKIVISAEYRWRVQNPKLYLLETTDTDEAVQDSIQVSVAQMVNNHTFEEVRANAFWEEATRSAAEAARAWGVRVTQVGYIDLAEIRTLRLMMDSPSWVEQD